MFSGISFGLNRNETETLNAWVKEMDGKALERQRENMTPEEFNMRTLGGRYPYGGASGGCLTYSFTPTSLGMVTKVTHALTGETLDLTDYEDW